MLSKIDKWWIIVYEEQRGTKLYYYPSHCSVFTVPCSNKVSGFILSFETIISKIKKKNLPGLGPQWDVDQDGFWICSKPSGIHNSYYKIFCFMKTPILHQSQSRGTESKSFLFMSHRLTDYRTGLTMLVCHGTTKCGIIRTLGGSGNLERINTLTRCYGSFECVKIQSQLTNLCNFIKKKTMISL